MKSFYTGDRVRLLHSQGQGIVLGRDPKGNVRVMLDDGFEIPVLDKDLALVHEQERRAMSNPGTAGGSDKGAVPTKNQPRPRLGDKAKDVGPIIQPRKEEVVARKGLYLALTAPLAGTKDRELFLLNNTSLYWAGTLGIRQPGVFRIESMFMAQPRQATRLATLSGAILMQNPVAEFWALAALLGGKEKPDALHTSWQINQDVQAKPMEEGPMLKRPSILYQLDVKETRLPGVDAAALLEKWTGGASEGKLAIVPPPRELDLHIEKLSPAAAASSPEEILRIQTKAFIQALDDASATGAIDLILIHGVGNGTLRTVIQKHISQRKDIEFYKDHMKERIGHGATFVKFKAG